jgi:hypothetical protein
MATYRVPLTSWANASVEVETDETDPVEIAKLAEEQVHVSLCHRCSGRDGLEIGDVWDAVMDGDKPEVYKISD